MVNRFQFLVVKFSIHLNRRVFVMFSANSSPLYARPTGDQEAAGVIPAGSATCFRGD